jgi:hypothetical protein
MDEVPGEAVVIVDHQDHSGTAIMRRSIAEMGARATPGAAAILPPRKGWIEAFRGALSRVKE